MATRIGTSSASSSVSSSQLAAAIYAAVCSFVYRSPIAKRLLVSSGEVSAYVLSGAAAANSSSVLHQLVSTGVSKSISAPVRLLSLSLVTALVGGAADGGIRATLSPPLRSALAHVVCLALHRWLAVPSSANRSTHTEAAANVTALLDALTAFLCCNVVYEGVGTGFSSAGAATANGVPAIGAFNFYAHLMNKDASSSVRSLHIATPSVPLSSAGVIVETQLKQMDNDKRLQQRIATTVESLAETMAWPTTGSYNTATTTTAQPRSSGKSGGSSRSLSGGVIPFILRAAANTASTGGRDSADYRDPAVFDFSGGSLADFKGGSSTGDRGGAGDASQSVSSSTQPRIGRHYNPAFNDTRYDVKTLVSLPDLLTWVCERFPFIKAGSSGVLSPPHVVAGATSSGGGSLSANGVTMPISCVAPTVLSAVCRCIGQLYSDCRAESMPHLAVGGSSFSSHAVSVNEVLLRVVIGIYNAAGNAVAAERSGGDVVSVVSSEMMTLVSLWLVASTALWTALHHSEKAKQVARELVCLFEPDDAFEDIAVAVENINSYISTIE